MKGYTRCSESPGTQSEGQGILPVEVMPNVVEIMLNPLLGGYTEVGLVMAEEVPHLHVFLPETEAHRGYTFLISKMGN